MWDVVTPFVWTEDGRTSHGLCLLAIYVLGFRLIFWAGEYRTDTESVLNWKYKSKSMQGHKLLMDF